MSKPRTIWRGVYPAATTQFARDLSIDMRATQAGFEALVRDGAHGLVLIGTVGEGNSLEADEKRAVLSAAVECVRGRVPIVVGVSELTTARAVTFARDAEKLGASGLMVLPAMVYVPTEDELVAHLREVARASTLPVMLYNNPPAYRVNIGLNVIKRLLDLPNVDCIKESASETTRFTDLANAFGDRLTLFAGLDDVALEALLLGASGWVSGLTNVFPRESLALWDAVQKGDLNTARSIYRWLMPLLHLDAGHDLVQAIKLAEQVVGRGSERVRPPRYPLTGERRTEVISLVERAVARRPELSAA
jgi:4-hydroxy-tetrahydrodipicolinate synthase